MFGKAAASVVGTRGVGVGVTVAGETVADVVVAAEA